MIALQFLVFISLKRFPIFFCYKLIYVIILNTLCITFLYLQVKNKLDDCLYAIKCIELNKKNKILNRKITREVKLLSRLNHENVVRYFNSWIEAAKVSQEGTPQKQVYKIMLNIYNI